MTQFIDLSIPITTRVISDPPVMLPQIEYVTHENTWAQIALFFPGLTREDLPDGEGWAVETLTLSTHNGTHMDAPWHYHSTTDAGARPAPTIDEAPLEIESIEVEANPELCKPLRDLLAESEGCGIERVAEIEVVPGHELPHRLRPAEVPHLEYPCGVVVDDEPQILRVLRHGLQAGGYRVATADTAAAAFREAASCRPDVIVLDLGLPDRDGKAALADIRAFSPVPIIVLSARDQEAEKIAALDLGADDYVEKPFGIGELLARLRAALRHADNRSREIAEIASGDLRIDFAARQVTVAGAEVQLTPKEYDLLSILARHAGKVLTHRQILAAVWGPAHQDDTQYLRVFIGQLRAKIDADPARPSLIRTETGIGYRFQAD